MGYRNNYLKDEQNKSNNGWYKCVSCGKSFRKNAIEIDHIIPQSYGGNNNVDNLQCMCRHCNRSKGNNLNSSYDDYVNNQVRRTPTDEKEMKELDKALNKGVKSFMNWFKK